MTKSIKRPPSLSCNQVLLTYVILAYTVAAHSSPPPCGLYGAPPCQFLPAPPGQTPTCARPGKTYCEHADNYPTYLIKSLVRKWGYEASTLLVDETWEDFAAVAWHDTPVFYDPKSIFPPRDPNAQDFNGYSYQTPFGGNPQRASGGGNSLFISNPSTEAPTYLLYTSSGGGHRSGQRYNAQGGGTSSSGGQLYFNHGGRSTPYNATLWLKRLVRDLSRKQKQANEHVEKEVVEPEPEQAEEEDEPADDHSLSKRDVSLNMDLLDIVGVDAPNPLKKRSRTKRQSPGRSTLCQTTSQFITPQAALNSRGNWMFVVNEQNVARQMVKAELCASNTCSNLCELPNGYNSRCEQKFVQKRLIALQGNGQNLYTDTFWFPSCCVCTIAAN
ncbi:protein spaetzle 5 [Drosophila eugracilis]|uniref:protein spaetzle 5 n=1 Tax=Drosophila eugracilis TaxID=29029 RepID=UPI0007E6E5C9|nr:protein spaetzle 5 [Drosophila eugracilis]XP_017071662.1 protein spaetzle 5 [Drosophila eugracilis]